MTKRQKFVVATFILLAGIIFSRVGLGQFLQWRFRIVIFTFFSLLFTLWSLKDEDFFGIEWVTLPILPVMFSLAALLVYPLLPTGFDSVLSYSITTDTSLILAMAVKIIYLACFVVGYYASILTANIYNIAAIRNIQLLRVAHSVGFLLTIATAFFYFVVIFSLHLSGLENFILVIASSGPLAFQAIWSVSLEERIGERTRNYALITTIILGEVAWALSFWPVGISIIALFLTSIFYEMVGIIQYHFDERLNNKVAYEFILVAFAVFLITIFTAQWGG